MKLDLKSVGIYYKNLRFVLDENAFLDYLRHYFIPLVQDEINNDSDFILLITGAERTGKSNLSLVIANEYLKAYNMRLSKIDKSIMGIKVEDVLPMLRKRLEELKNKINVPRVYIIDEGAQFYSKWRQMTRESYEVFLIYRLMGFCRIFWIINYQSLLDAGELFKTGRADAWFYTFMDKQKNKYVAVIPDRYMRRVFVKMRLSKKFRMLVDLAHQFPQLFFERVLKIKDLANSPIKVFRAPKFENWDAYIEYKIAYNEDRMKFLEKYLSNDFQSMEINRKIENFLNSVRVKYGSGFYFVDCYGTVNKEEDSNPIDEIEFMKKELNKPKLPVPLWMFLYYLKKKKIPHYVVRQSNEIVGICFYLE